MTDSWLEAVPAAGRAVRLSHAHLDVLAGHVARVASDDALLATLATLHLALAVREPSDALRAVREAQLEDRLGLARARETYLILALSQVPLAAARHARQGIPPSMSADTLADLSIWVLHFELQTGVVGITVEILDWAQRYLRGELVRIGALQFELRPFGGPIRAYRQRESRALAVVDLEGVSIDPTTGDRALPAGGAELTRPTFDAGWEIALDPTSLVLDMHIPAGTKLGEREMSHAVRDGLTFFDAREPERPAVGAAGDAWLLDPQVRFLLPKNEGLHAVQRDCCLYPSKLLEAKTIRRLFGPDVTREHLPHLPRELMTSLLRAVVDHLAAPENTLRARGGFILREELDAILRRVDAPGTT